MRDSDYPLGEILSQARDERDAYGVALARAVIKVSSLADKIGRISPVCARFAQECRDEIKALQLEASKSVK